MALHGRAMITKGGEYSRIIDPNGMNESGDTHTEKTKVIRNMICEQLLKAHERISHTINNVAGTREIDLSKNTYLRNMKLPNAGERYSKKLGLKYLPVTIVEDTYMVAAENGKIMGKFHSSLLIQR